MGVEHNIIVMGWGRIKRWGCVVCIYCGVDICSAVRVQHARWKCDSCSKVLMSLYCQSVGRDYKITCLKKISIVKFIFIDNI